MRRRRAAACSRREALSPGAAAKATRTACTTETSRDHPRSPEITRDLPRSPEISRDLPSDEGRLHDMSPAGLQRKRDEPARTARGGGIGRRNEGDGRRGAQVAVRQRARRRPVPPRARLAPPRRRAVLCSRRRRTAAPGAGAVALALRCLPAGGRGTPPAPGGMCHGHVMDMSRTCPAGGAGGPPVGMCQSNTVPSHNDCLPLLRTPRAPRRRRVAPRT